MTYMSVFFYTRHDKFIHLQTSFVVAEVTPDRVIWATTKLTLGEFCINSPVSLFKWYKILNSLTLKQGKFWVWKNCKLINWLSQDERRGEVGRKPDRGSQAKSDCQRLLFDIPSTYKICLLKSNIRMNESEHLKKFGGPYSPYSSNVNLKMPF